MEAEFGNFLEDDDALEMGIRMDLNKSQTILYLNLVLAHKIWTLKFAGTSIDSGIQYLEASPTSAACSR